MLVVVVAAFTCVVLVGLLAGLFSCEASLALTLCSPASLLDALPISVLVKVADPLASALLTAVPPSALSVTLPVGVPALALTVTVTTPSAGYVTDGALIVVVVVARTRMVA